VQHPSEQEDPGRDLCASSTRGRCFTSSAGAMLVRRSEIGRATGLHDRTISRTVNGRQGTIQDLTLLCDLPDPGHPDPRRRRMKPLGANRCCSSWRRVLLLEVHIGNTVPQNRPAKPSRKTQRRNGRVPQNQAWKGKRASVERYRPLFNTRWLGRSADRSAQPNRLHAVPASRDPVCHRRRACRRAT
jgi:hypothetical protein